MLLKYSRSRPAPKKQKAQKMALTDFFNDTCELALGLACLTSPRFWYLRLPGTWLTLKRSVDRGSMMSSVSPQLVSCTRLCRAMAHT